MLKKLLKIFNIKKIFFLINGFAIKATYNPPWTLPPFRRNEVMFNIKWENLQQ